MNLLVAVGTDLPLHIRGNVSIHELGNERCAGDNGLPVMRVQSALLGSGVDARCRRHALSTKRFDSITRTT